MQEARGTAILAANASTMMAKGRSAAHFHANLAKERPGGRWRCAGLRQNCSRAKRSSVRNLPNDEASAAEGRSQP
jgi:hypothetical protein